MPSVFPLIGSIAFDQIGCVLEDDIDSSDALDTSEPPWDNKRRAEHYKILADYFENKESEYEDKCLV